jgi:hypothetical protein
MAATSNKPPKTVGQSGRELWQEITTEFEIDDAASRALLLQVCQCTNRLAEISQRISREGLVIDSKGGPRDHPLLKSEIACRSFIICGLQRLGLEPSRPVGRPGNGLTGGWVPPELRRRSHA